MADNFTEQMLLLAKLQKIDTEVSMVKISLGDLAEQLKEIDDREAVFKKTTEDTATDLEAVQKEYRELDRQIKENADSAAQKDARLTSIKTNKEYHAILKEIEELNKKNSALEDTMLEYLEKIEAGEKAVKATKKTFTEEKKLLAEDRSAIKKQTKGIEAKLEELAELRLKALDGIEPKMLDIFKRTTRIVIQPAIAAAIKSVCMGCNMNIPPQFYNELQKSDKVRNCPHCHRIIYWEKPTE